MKSLKVMKFCVSCGLIAVVMLAVSVDYQLGPRLYIMLKLLLITLLSSVHKVTHCAQYYAHVLTIHGFFLAELFIESTF